jgi:DNA-binding NarL/FixJ family response regulator
VLIVDDAVVVRRMLTSVIEKHPLLEVAGIAANGKIALQKITQCNPDIITLDVEMPEMDGIATLKALRKTHPRLPVVMVSTLTSRGAETTIEALNAGATDYVTKPGNVGKIVEGIELIEQELVPKILAICSRQLPAHEVAATRPVPGAPRHATTKTSLVRSASHDKSVPNIRAATPPSDLPPLTPASALSTSSIMRIDGAVASAIAIARRTFASDWPTSDPIKAPTSSRSVGRPHSFPRALAMALLPQPGSDSRSTPLATTCVGREERASAACKNALRAASPPRSAKRSAPS